jgi:hypothetical protein
MPNKVLPDLVHDEWSGGREWVLETFPGMECGPDAHEHTHHDGCYYWHEHPHEGPHGHRKLCSDPGCNHISRRA